MHIVQHSIVVVLCIIAHMLSNVPRSSLQFIFISFLSRVYINKYFRCVLYLTQICACINEFISVWTCVPHMKAHKNL